MKFKPHNYQLFSSNHIIDNPRTGLFLDMGLGKTVTTLTAIDQLLFLGEINKVLVIAPKRVAENTWSDEVEKWDHLKHLKVSKVLGTPKKRIERLKDEANIYIISRDNLEWLIKNYFKSWPFDMCVIDELSSFKNSKSKRFKALRKVRGSFKRIVGLTGTPTPNSLIDLWPQMYLIDGGKRLERTLTAYRDKYFNAGRRNGAIIYDWNLKDNSEKEIFNKISDICVSMKAKDYLDLPERIDNEIYIDLDSKSKDLYKKLEKDLILNDDIIATNSAVLSNKLLQISNGAIYNEAKEIIELHNLKLVELKNIIDESQGKPVLVFYNFKHDLTRIKKYIKNIRTLENTKDIRDWNEGKIPILLVHPASAGHGLNLQQGGNIIVWFGLNWSLELYQQANARLYRQGQKEKVIIHHLISKNTIDEDVIAALKNKDINQEKLLEAIKARLHMEGYKNGDKK